MSRVDAIAANKLIVASAALKRIPATTANKLVIARAAGQLVIAQVAKNDPSGITSLKTVGFIRTNNDGLADDVLNFTIRRINKSI